MTVEQYITDELMDTSLLMTKRDYSELSLTFINMVGLFWVLHGLSRVNRSFYNVHSVAIWFGDCMVCFYEAAQTA